MQSQPRPPEIHQTHSAHPPVNAPGIPITATPPPPRPGAILAPQNASMPRGPSKGGNPHRKLNWEDIVDYNSPQEDNKPTSNHPTTTNKSKNPLQGKKIKRTPGQQPLIPIIIDTREQRPLLYDKEGHPGFEGLSIRYDALQTGDYSLSGYSIPAPDPDGNPLPSITIERKSLPDLFQSVSGKNRARFEAEFRRMSNYDFAALVVEADLLTWYAEPPATSSMRPKSVYRTIIAWCQRYGVHLYPCPSRPFAEETIYIILRRYWDDHQPGGKRHRQSQHSQTKPDPGRYTG